MKKFEGQLRRGCAFVLCHYRVLLLMSLLPLAVTRVFATPTMWEKANDIIRDVYGKIAGISTALAGAMSAVAVIGAKLSNNQHKVDQSWDWLKRIWVAWAVINGIGAFLAYLLPFFQGLNTLDPDTAPSDGGGGDGGDGGWWTF